MVAQIEIYNNGKWHTFTFKATMVSIMRVLHAARRRGFNEAYVHTKNGGYYLAGTKLAKLAF